MKRRQYLAPMLLAFLAMFSACSTIRVEKDNFSGDTVVKTRGHRLKSVSNPSSSWLENDGVVFECRKILHGANAPIYEIEVLTDSPRRIGGKDSLLIKADGELFTFSSGDQSNQQFVYDYNGIPANTFGLINYRGIPAPTFEKIVNAKLVEVRLNTPSGPLDGLITAPHQQALVQLIGHRVE